MGLLNTYYRGFIDYRKNTENDKPSKRDRKVLATCNDAFEKFVVTKYQVEIDEEWVKEIEKGLEFVEKAIKEERQFIRTNGEIVPIEKAKKVSRDSVSHLARHSNMITHIPEDPNATLVPDSIFMVEKLNDYTVYENRFLYMLLCYLRDFIELRIQKITDIRMTYICDFELKRSNASKKRNMDFQTIYHEERKDNPYPIDNEDAKNVLQRVFDCQQIVTMLLNTNLMVEVSKAPMIKPPIVKTNVLKMNNNFKNALALYDYIVNYNKDGYTSKEIVTNFVPLNDQTLDELMELPTLTYFLTYKYGNELTEQLKKEYLEEEEIKRKKEAEALNEQIKRLKKKILESGMGMEEYMLMLEKRNRMLEEDSQELQKAKATIVELNKKIELLKLEIDGLNEQIVNLQGIIEDKLKEIAYLKQKYIDDMNALKEAHQEEIEALNQEHEEEIDELKASFDSELRQKEEAFENEMNELKEVHQEEMDALNMAHYNEVEEIKATYESTLLNRINEYEKTIKDLENQVIDYQNQQADLIKSNEEERNELRSNISSLQNEKNQLITDYEEKLKALEKKFEDEMSDATNDFNIKISENNNVVEKAVDERNLMAAELRAIRVKHELLTPSENYTSEERFTQLEEEFEAFNKFFKAQWKLTKKAIRKQLLWTKAEKKNKKKINEASSLNLTSALDTDGDINKDIVDDISSDEKNNE